MTKMWTGRTAGQTDKAADDFNSSIGFDSRMYRQDIMAGMAHAAMLGAQKIITEEDADAIIRGLEGILADIDSGKLEIDMSCEDIHMFVEQVLTERIGDAGKKLHTARSRNDQVAQDLRLYLRDEISDMSDLACKLARLLLNKAEKYTLAVMPGYTHLQRAQPVSFGHYLMAYVFMLLRDTDRFSDCLKRMNVSPIGACALAGTTYDTDRKKEASDLGFDGICMNSIDAVSDRDFCAELLSVVSICMMHLSRLSEELVLWSSSEFAFIELSDGYTTGSSIMPQKKNPDMAELVRGKTGRVYGDLIAMLTVLKGLPLAYNKDLQEDKEGIFDACDTLKASLGIMAGMIETMSVREENLRRAAQTGFINATDVADYLVRKGLPFRSAYKISGQIVAECINENCILEDYPLEKYRKFSDLFDDDLYDFIDIETCMNKRESEGGTSVKSVLKQIEYAKKRLG